MRNLVTSEAIAAFVGASEQIRSLLNINPNGSGPWGSRGDLMGLLVRLPFHDATTYNPNLLNISGNSDVGGSDGCVDLDSPENTGLEEAIDLLEPIRMNYSYEMMWEEGNVTTRSFEFISKADFWVLAGNIMLEEAGAPAIDYQMGRTDSSNCKGQGSRHVNAESKSSKETAQTFVNRLGFSHREVVALIGAHVLGKNTHANSGYEGKWVKRNDQFTNQYFVDMVHQPWVKQKRQVPDFGIRTSWHRISDETMMDIEDEIMLQTDVDLAFQTSGGPHCFRVGGRLTQNSCPNATHEFASHFFEFAIDEDAWKEEFLVAWPKLASMTSMNSRLECVLESCKTPSKQNLEASNDRSSSQSKTKLDFIISWSAIFLLYFLLT